MTSFLDTDRSVGDRARTRAYLREFAPGMVGYLAVLALVLAWGDLDGTSGWRYLWAVLPVLPALGVVRAAARHVRRVDDYQRSLLLGGLATSFAVTMVAALTLGFLQVAGLEVPGTGWVLYGVGMLSWLVAGVLSHRR